MSEKEVPDHIAIDAFNLTEHSSAVQAKDDLERAIYGMWVDEEDPQNREKLHSLAVASNMWWSILGAWAQKGNRLVGNEDEIIRRHLRGIQ